MAIVYAQSDDYPAIADVTGDFVYARLETAVEQEPLGYAATALDRWAGAAKSWAAGDCPPDLPYVAELAAQAKRDVFLFFISGAKVRNPAAAQALIERI